MSLTSSKFPTPINAFASSASRITDERDDRLANAKLALGYQHSFLDDVTRGIFPHDLILIGAPSGIGKTDIAVQIAAANVGMKAPVAFFALEAEPREIERRIKFAMISKWVHKHNEDVERGDATGKINTEFVNYPDWMCGRLDGIPAVSVFEDKSNAIFLTKFGLLHTFYRSIDFGYDELRTAVTDIAPKVRLIIIDHLHYIDIDDDNENRGLSDTMKMLRDMSILHGKPIILIAHLRKRGQSAKQLVADKDDFHGSSNIVKQATHAIVLDRSPLEPPKWWLSPTFCTVVKDRRGGNTNYTALTYYNMLTRSYQRSYTLGRVIKGNTDWEEIPTDRIPTWAKNHKSISGVSEHRQGGVG